MLAVDRKLDCGRWDQEMDARSNHQQKQVLNFWKVKNLKPAKDPCDENERRGRKVQETIAK